METDGGNQVVGVEFQEVRIGSWRGHVVMGWSLGLQYDVLVSLLMDINICKYV